jgi:hypothetical protein
VSIVFAGSFLPISAKRLTFYRPNENSRSDSRGGAQLIDFPTLHNLLISRLESTRKGSTMCSSTRDTS